MVAHSEYACITRVTALEKDRLAFNTLISAYLIYQQGEASVSDSAMVKLDIRDLHRMAF